MEASSRFSAPTPNDEIYAEQARHDRALISFAQECGDAAKSEDQIDLMPALQLEIGSEGEPAPTNAVWNALSRLALDGQIGYGTRLDDNQERIITRIYIPNQEESA